MSDTPKILSYIDPSRLGRVLSFIVFFISALIFVPLIFFEVLKMIQTMNWRHHSLIYVVLIFIYPIFAYILGRFIAVAYNLYASKWGGLEMRLQDYEP